MTLRDRLWRRFAELPELPALHTHPPGKPHAGRWLTYGELGQAIEQTAQTLVAAGAEPGTRVGVMLPNGEPFVRTWLATVALNVTMVPVNIQLVGAGLRHVLRSAELDLLVVDEGLVEAALEACEGVAPARTVLTWGEEVDGTELAPIARPLPSFYPWAHPPPRGPAHSPGAGVYLARPDRQLFPSPSIGGGARGGGIPVDPADLALIIFTSGTTGPSKGVMLSRTAQLWHGLNYLSDFIQLGPGETGYTPLPLFHVSAQGFTLGCLLGGAAVAVDERFLPFSFWAALRRYNAKAFNYVGAMIPLLYHRRPRADDTDNPVERAVGSATAPELHEAFERRFGLRLIESYGQSEMAGLWLTDPPDGRRIGSVGKPREGLEARVLRDDGSEAALDEHGEIVVRAADPLLMSRGYLNDPGTTARAFRGGWYYTGDAGSRDANGYFRFRGRLKDFIRRRGENISAFEIEREALTHPAVREAAAVGVPSALGEEEVKLCVLLHSGVSLDPADLDHHLAPRLATFMRPRYIEIREEFPRTPTQRVQKFKLRAEGVSAATWDRRPARE